MNSAVNEGQNNEVARPRPPPQNINNDINRASNHSGSCPHVPHFLYRNSKTFPASESAITASDIDSAWRSQIPNSTPDNISTHSFNRPHQPCAHSPLQQIAFMKPEPINPETPRYKKNSGACCCCCRSRTGALCCGLFTAFFVIGIALAAFFLWPRVPIVKLASITQKGFSTPIQSANFAEVFQTSQTGYSASVQINLVVTNNNYIDLIINSLNFKGGLKGSSGLNINNFVTGSLPGSVNLKSQATSPFNIPVTLSFPLNDVNQISVLAKACLQKEQVSIPYTISLSLALVSWTGYKPSISDSFSFACPWTIPTS